MKIPHTEILPGDSILIDSDNENLEPFVVQVVSVFTRSFMVRWASAANGFAGLSYSRTSGSWEMDFVKLSGGERTVYKGLTLYRRGFLTQWKKLRIGILVSIVD